ncbi:MAG: SLC13 family permease [Alphaproteobacteria bacterium]|nr:SLC13 family permease [Alphaproteobacteria bacterium]
MWVVIVVMAAAMVSFALERISLEMTSLLALGFLLLWFQIAPLTGADGEPLLPPQTLLQGFANPSLLAVLALLVMGQGMIQTGALNGLTSVLVQATRKRKRLGAAGVFLGVLLVSAFLNNTPVVVMFIPIMQTIALRLGWAGSRLMMPLSYAAILGGMTTMIGSSTNLLVSSALIDLGQRPLEMFEFTRLAAAMAAVGAVYVIFILPRLLPDRGTLAGSFVGEGKQFIAEIDITPESRLVGARAAAGTFKELPDVTVRLVKRGEQIMLPPFDDVVLRPGDVLIVAATRQALTEALTRNAGYLLTHEGHDAIPTGNGTGRRPAERVLTEVMIAPASRMIDQTVDMIGFRRRFGSLVLGIQRRGRMARMRIGEIRLEAGDVLLIAGPRESVDALANNPDLLLMAWTTRELPELQRAPHAVLIFLATVALAASGFLPIPVAAFVGATAMIATGCLNLRQAIRAMDRTILLLVGSALALGKALEATGGAQFLARAMIESFGGTDPLTNMALLFIIVALGTNVLTNNATAVLFTPIGINLAFDLGLDPSVMAITVLLAANCSFATPIGYQTNLLVMGPGHYRFSDFLRGGVPLMLLMWLVFCLLAPLHFGL